MGILVGIVVVFFAVFVLCISSAMHLSGRISEEERRAELQWLDESMEEGGVKDICPRSNFHNGDEHEAVSVPGAENTYQCECGCKFVWESAFVWRILDEEEQR